MKKGAKNIIFHYFCEWNLNQIVNDKTSLAYGKV